MSTTIKVTIEQEQANEAKAKQQKTANKDERMTHMPNPSIPVRYYNLATHFCYQHDNMTRMDWMEMAIVNQLKSDGLITDEEQVSRINEIRSRPPRGMRKGTKNNK